jgi:hypothetical protein
MDCVLAILVCGIMCVKKESISSLFKSLQVPTSQTIFCILQNAKRLDKLN